MQIVIEIPTEQYEILCKQKDRPCRLLIEKAITDGIILPKGHGDLVDRSKIDMSKEWRNVSLSDKSLWIANGILNDSKVVIPADKDGDAK